MNTFFKNILFFMALTSGGWLGVTLDANAEDIPGGCTPAPYIIGQPQKCWDGRIIPPRNVFNSGNPYNGVMGQPAVNISEVFTAVSASGQKLRCTWKDRAATAGLYGAAGALAGAAADALAKKGDNRFLKAGALAGAAAGATLVCDPEMVDDGETVTQTTQKASGGGTCRNDHTGETRRFRTYEECKAWIGGEVKVTSR